MGAIVIYTQIDRLPTGEVKSEPYRKMQPLLMLLALLYVVAVIIIRGLWAEPKSSKPEATGGFPRPPKANQAQKDSGNNARI